MLLSYCYIFSHSPSSTIETQPASTPLLDPHTPSPPTSSPASSSEVAFSVLSTLSDWSSSVTSSIRSTVPTFLPSLFSTESSGEGNDTDSSHPSTSFNLLPSALTSWFASPSSDPPQTTPVPEKATIRSTRSLLREQQPQEPSVPTAGRTTFTFVLFGAASSAAVYFLVRNRRTMNRLNSAKSLAYCDARAWRRVALDFARINALAASRVQNLVAASLRDGSAGTEIGRQIERELQDASRVVAQRRNWILEHDRKDAETGPSSSTLRGFGHAWVDAFDPDRTGFFFGSRGGRRGSELGHFGQWKPTHVSRHDDVSSIPSETNPKSTSSSTPERSAKIKWQRVAGHAAAAAPTTAEDSDASNASAIVDQQAEAREEWIGDVENAIRERDLNSSQATARVTDQAAVDAFSGHESEEYVEAITGFATRNAEGRESVADEQDHLLPVSDLHIATGGNLRDEVASSRNIKQTTKMSPTQVNTIVSSTPKYSYPISDRFRDMEELLLAAYDDNFAGFSSPSAPDTVSKPVESAKDVTAKPNSALFDKLRANRANIEKAKSSSAAEDIDFMAELIFRDDSREAELVGYKYKIDELSERLDTMREMCHDLTDEAQRREKSHKIQIEQLDHKVGLFTVWAEEVQRRLGLETPPFFASLRKPLKRD
ncbi:uncharacterized protein UTRI_01297_B [Ustilago trichophora]|uniref:Uncharacterized protein n=1 Tax=Ustilago trichophora TaxID=86804 RepID=A0A5C3DU40_9BASI|nr:uncharacterized protein UTRI_01297_B [Ustilago trichophora]